MTKATKKDPEIGETYGTWLVVNLGARDSFGQRRWNCKCVGCGRGKLTTKREIMCCRKCRVCWGNPSDRRSVHTLGPTWSNIIRRCYSVNATGYSRYGARGITVYQPWRESFSLFVSYIERTLGPRPKGKSLDRVNNDGDYCPGNLKWSTSSEQAENRRDNYLIEHAGQTKCLSAWAEETGILRGTLEYRLATGWTTTTAFTTPVGSSKLTLRQARQIRGAYRKEGVTQIELAKKYGVHRTAISQVVRNEIHKES